MAELGGNWGEFDTDLQDGRDFGGILAGMEGMDGAGARLRLRFDAETQRRREGLYLVADVGQVWYIASPS